MKVFLVEDRYYMTTLRDGPYCPKILGYYDTEDQAHAHAVRFRRLYNGFHDIVIVPYESRPKSEHVIFRLANDLTWCPPRAFPPKQGSAKKAIGQARRNRAA